MMIKVTKYFELLTYRNFSSIEMFKKFIDSIINKHEKCVMYFEEKYPNYIFSSEIINTNIHKLKNKHIVNLVASEEKNKFKQLLNYEIPLSNFYLQNPSIYTTECGNFIYFIKDNNITYSIETHTGLIYKYCLDEYRFDNAINEIEKNKIKQMYNDDQVINDFIDFGVRISEIENYEDKENIFKFGCKVHSDIFKEYKEEYRNNIDIAFEAIKKSMHNYNYAGEDVKNNKEVLDYIKKKEEELFKDL